MNAEKFNWKYRLKEWFFRTTSSKKIPLNNLIIICNPRSGSTWLFDALRSHPKITFSKKATFHALFKIQGNRYPGDLLKSEGTGIPVEIRPGRKKRIRRLEIPTAAVHQSLNEFFIEKIHPHFYHYDTDGLIKEIEAQKRKGKHFKILILSRNPEEAFRSIKNYRQRNPEWFTEAVVEELEILLDKTYSALLDLKEKYADHLILDYSEFKNNPNKSIKDIANYIWSDSNYLISPTLVEDCQKMLDLTRKEKITSGDSKFVQKYNTQEITPISNNSPVIQTYRKLISD